MTTHIRTFVISLASILFALGATAGANAQNDDPDMWIYGNLITQDILLIMEMDMGDEDTARMMLDLTDMVISELVDDPTELPDFFPDIVEAEGLVKDNSEELAETCRTFYGHSSTVGQNMFAIICHKDESLFVIYSNLNDGEALYDVTESILFEDKKRDWVIPEGFIEIPS